MEFKYTFCDKCNPNATTIQHNGRGYTTWDFKTARDEFGWKKKKGQHICPDCLDEELSTILLPLTKL